MPYYTVTYDIWIGGRASRVRTFAVYGATPKDAAKEVLERETHRTNTKIIRVREDTNYADRQYWRKQWRAAFNNMPHRIGHNKYWVPCDRGTVPLPDFIKKRAKKKMKVEGGIIFEEIKRQYHYGQLAALARCMGETNARWMCQHINTNRARGTKPRDPARQAMLLALAGPDGCKFAIAKLTELGIIHRYEV